MSNQAYQVFARKYRPQKLSELVGQDTFVKTVSNAIRFDRVGHAYLFTGVRGVGKTSSARILAKSLNCHEGPTIEPCLICQNCKEITTSNSIDVVELDAASHTGVDNVREIIENSHYSPATSRFKIYIIDEVHMLSGSAFNALLKTLEEPPAHVKFIFATTEVHKIPMTILSRVQRFDFKKISRKDMVNRLDEICKNENCSITNEALSAIAYEGDGSMRDALSLLDKVVSFSDNSKALDLATIEEIIGYSGRTALFTLLEAVFLKDRQRLLSELRTVYQSNLNLKKFFSEIIESIRHAIVLKTTNDNLLVDLEHQDIEWLQKITSKYSEIDLIRILEHLLEKSQKFSISPYPHIVFELSLLQILQIPVIVPIDQLLVKLEQLEQSFGNVTVSSDQYARAKQDITQSQKYISAPSSSETETTSNHSLSSLPKEWLRIITLAKQKNPSWSSVMEQVKLIEFHSDNITLGFENLFVYDKFHNTDLKKWFENTTKDTFSKNVIFQYLSKEQMDLTRGEPQSFEQKKKPDEITARALQGRSVFEEQQREKESMRLEKIEHIRKDPSVKTLEKVFGAKILSVELFEENK